MFGVLGFLPGWGISRMLLRLGVLRVSPEIEIAGLDTVVNIETAEDELIRDADNSLLVRHRAAWSRYMTGNHVVA